MVMAPQLYVPSYDTVDHFLSYKTGAAIPVCLLDLREFVNTLPRAVIGPANESHFFLLLMHEYIHVSQQQ